MPSALVGNGHDGNADPKTHDIASDLPAQHAADPQLHMLAPAHGQVDKGELASPKLADDRSFHSAHATGEDTSVPSIPADTGHHPIADPEINLASVAPTQPPEHPSANLPPAPTQPEDGPHPAHPPIDVNGMPSFKFADNGSDHDTGPEGAHTPPPQADGNQLKLADASNDPGAGLDGIHPADPQVDANQFDILKLAKDADHPDATPTNAPTALTGLSSDPSGTHGPAAPTLAKTFDVPDAGTNQAADQFIFAEKAGHDPVADHKLDVVEIDHSLASDLQQLLEIADQANPASTLDLHPAIAPQDTAKVQAQHYQDAFHLA